MKILLIGDTQPHALEAIYHRLFLERGHEVRWWNNKAVPRWWRRGSWWHLSRPERSIFDAVASIGFYRVALSWKPDVLFVPKGENIHSYAIRRVLEKTKARLVIAYPDHPFKADQTSMNVLRNLKRTSLFYIWGKFLIEPLCAAGCRRVEYLPFGFDPVFYPADGIVTEQDRQRYGCDILFVGTWDEERQRSLLPLAEFDLGIWGPGWVEHCPRDHPLRAKVRGGALYLGEMVKAFRCAKLCFNHLRLHNGSAHNQRTMEITGVGGGVMVVRRTAEQARELFREGEEILCFESDEELVETVREAVTGPQARLGAMAEAAKARVFREHLWSQRADKIVEDLAELL